MRSFLFVARVVFAWVLALIVLMFIWRALTGRNPPEIFGLIIIVTLLVAIVKSVSHAHRVGLIAERVDGSTLANRHRRRIEIPFRPDEAFDIVEAAVRELPNVELVDTARDSLQVRARVLVRHRDAAKPRQLAAASSGPRNLVVATVAPGGATGSLTLLCEPEFRPWRDWLFVDHGTNLENAEAITRAITRRIAERRKGEEATVRETVTEKELTVAKLSLLHAQVEPHFLYNTLASAQVLTRSDPARADEMLGHLIAYLRKSLPRTEASISTLGEELERARAYLEILRIRMGERLKVQIQVPDALKSVPMPPMMLQTLVENAVKHGLEPELAGGTVWIIAREVDGKVAVSVADDGRGFSTEGGGTAIGLNNVRERLRLAYGDAASFSIVSNFPKGVAATITVPPSPSSPSPLGEGRGGGGGREGGR
jgi:signal transduction histidine kinase